MTGISYNLVPFIRFKQFVKINLWKWMDEPFVHPKPEFVKQQELFDG